MSVEIEDEEAPAVVGDKDKRGASKEAPESLEKEAKVEGHSPGEREVSPSSRGRSWSCIRLQGFHKDYKKEVAGAAGGEARERLG